MSVVGIDFGGNTCKVAVARRAAITVVRNEESNYLTPSIVGYTDRERLIGAAGEARWKSNAKNTVSELKRLIRRPHGDGFTSDNEWLMFETVRSQAGYVNVKVRYQGEDIELTPEQVLGALLVKLKQMVSTACDGAKVKDVVISCPNYFADSQRQAILEAAEIAGLHVLRIMNETTAAALNWGILRPLPKEETHKVAIVDVGEQHTNVTIVDFTEGKLAIAGTASHPNVGGRDFDRILFNYFNTQFQEKHKIDLRSKAKSTLRLITECKKIKKMLSSNTNAYKGIECIYGDYDMDLKITREEFEEAAQPLLKELEQPMRAALRKAKCKAEEIKTVEIIGGSSRMPMIQKMVSEVFGQNVSRTLDGDESVCRGCALQCAMLSPQFRVKNFEVIDKVNYPITVRWGPVTGDPSDEETTDKSSGSSPLFTGRDPVPCTKMITFKIPNTFQLQARYSNPADLPPGVDPFIGRFIINLPPKTDDAKSAKTKVKFVVDKCGMLRPPTATFIEEVPIPPEAEGPAPAEGGLQAAAAAAEPKKDGDAMDTDEKNTTSEEATPPADGAEEPKKKKQKTHKTKRTTINVDSILFYGTPPDAQKAAVAQEGQMQANDNKIKEWEKVKNDVESFVLTFRDQVYDQLAEFVSDEARGNIMAKLDETESWLYSEEGELADLKAYREKLAELEAIGAPVRRRKYESDRRATAVEVLKKTINRYNQAAADEGEAYAHIPRAERDKITAACTEADTWLLEKQQAQDKVDKTEDPVLLSGDLSTQVDKLKTACQPILDRAPPTAPNPKALEDKRAREEAERKAKKEAEAAGGGETKPEGDAEMKDAAPAEEQLPPEQGPAAPMDVDEAPAE